MEKLTNYELFKQQTKDKFYIYLHITKDERIPFYVGKGKNNRCFHTSNRSK